MATEVLMPELGESIIEGTIVRWLVDEGSTVNEFDPLVEIETDKVTTEVTAAASGVVLKICAEEGETIAVGTVLALIGESGEEVSGPAPETAVSQNMLQPAPPTSAQAPAIPSVNNGSNHESLARISPLVARIASEHNIDIRQVPGTGRDGRVTKKDILAYIEQGETPPATTLPPSSTQVDHIHKAPPPVGQPGELIQLSRMRQLIAEHMVMSKLETAPHVTTVFEADLSAITQHRANHKADFAARGINLTFTAYFVVATARALRAHPMVNSKWTGEGIYLYPDVNIGMAVAIDEGLIVPVIKRADELSLQGAARQVNDLSTRAREDRLNPDDISGGTFTITNHGVSGSLFATPIINQPQTGILGLGAIQKRVVVIEDDAIAIRPMVYISLTFDHRVLDGAGADYFVSDIKKALENWPR
jgi:2-oxoisovalerate dehydrogenase E2 component (dihydrolipoyl transacylase)